MLTNDDRKEVLEIFADLYAKQDLNTMIEHMPNDVNDPDGEVFSDYFDFLQSLYALRGDVSTMESEEHLDFRVDLLFSHAKKFGYPTSLIEVFDG